MDLDIIGGNKGFTRGLLEAGKGTKPDMVHISNGQWFVVECFRLMVNLERG